PGFAHRLGFATEIHVGAAASLIPLACLAVGAGGAGLLWRGAAGADPARALGPARVVLAEAFYLDAVQDFLVVRPMLALAPAVRSIDEWVADGAVEATGGGTGWLGALLSGLHRAALPRAATAVLAAAVLFGLVAAVILGGAR